MPKSGLYGGREILRSDLGDKIRSLAIQSHRRLIKRRLRGTEPWQGGHSLPWAAWSRLEMTAGSQIDLDRWFWINFPTKSVGKNPGGVFWILQTVWCRHEWPYPLEFTSSFVEPARTGFGWQFRQSRSPPQQPEQDASLSRRNHVYRFEIHLVLLCLGKIRSPLFRGK